MQFHLLCTDRRRKRKVKGKKEKGEGKASEQKTKLSFFGERCREEDTGIWEEGILNRIYENLMLKNWYLLCSSHNTSFESHGHCKTVNYLCHIPLATSWQKSHQLHGH